MCSIYHVLHRNPGNAFSKVGTLRLPSGVISGRDDNTDSYPGLIGFVEVKERRVEGDGDLPMPKRLRRRAPQLIAECLLDTGKVKLLGDLDLVRKPLIKWSSVAFSSTFERPPWRVTISLPARNLANIS
jgi:hypothetical protein